MTVFEWDPEDESGDRSGERRLISFGKKPEMQWPPAIVIAVCWLSSVMVDGGAVIGECGGWRGAAVDDMVGFVARLS